MAKDIHIQKVFLPEYNKKYPALSLDDVLDKVRERLLFKGSNTKLLQSLQWDPAPKIGRYISSSEVVYLGELSLTDKDRVLHLHRHDLKHNTMGIDPKRNYVSEGMKARGFYLRLKETGYRYGFYFGSMYPYRLRIDMWDMDQLVLNLVELALPLVQGQKEAS